ncbi:MAG: biotin--[acetyl-CoA-carboxylase] ligase [Verrucomicrobia bacterium]|nr:biotin--[acetyl-CoA-carboxylase] ligase [Verrucomicrobiota bacterium]MBU1736466.1 biotin--[acetyl-CoA-carboxylase] ligase [Verrucomicrobiota bacterium]MBU1857233.1 biotin--[acetyl-CoA-carboxylase] ligase [Verrucomicrobiota bacterium]
MKRRLEKIRMALEDCRLGQPLLFLDKTGSTNEVLKARAEKGAPEGYTVVADHQTCGRGRQGRHWLSLPGKGVYLSVLLRPNWPATDGVFMNICASVAVARALEKWRPKQIRLKWPNDVMLNGRKIAGVLVEPRIKRAVIEFAVVGIGVNVLHCASDFEPLGQGIATSLRLEGVNVDCDRVLARVLNELDICYTMARQDDKSRILQEWSLRQFGK